MKKLRPVNRLCNTSLAIGFLLCFLFSHHIFAQQSIKLINSHSTGVNKKDLNQIYINAQVAKIGNLDSSLFESGFIFKNTDIIKCKIYLHKGKLSDDHYLYIIARGPKDSIYVLTPKEIDGYGVNNIIMKSHRSASSDTNYFFLKLIEEGEVTLYERAPVPSDEEEVYYFKKQKEKELFFFAPNKKSDVYMPERDSKDNPLLSKYTRPDEKSFVKAFSEYFKDCQSVRNKILERFYTMTDIESMIREYNSCKK